MDPLELKSTIVKLAHFDPAARDDYGYQVIDYLVLDALATFGPLLLVTAQEVKENIKRSFHIDFDEAEINASAMRLASRGQISLEDSDDRHTRPSFKIDPETEEQISKNISQIKVLETEVIDAWKDELVTKYTDYPILAERIDDIVNCLQVFLTRILVKHGAECAALLYPDSQKTRQWLRDVQGAALEGIPKIEPVIDSIVQLEIPLFFQSSNSKRQVFVSSIFNSSFFWHLVQVDQSLSQLLKEVTRGQRLYLDNNILYNLVGLDGAAKLAAVHSMLKIAKDLGYELWVTTKSIDEFHESLRWNVEQLKLRPPLPSELARIAVEHLGADSFVTLYWKSFVKNGISIEEFYAEKSHIEVILGSLDIQTTNKFRKDIDESQELIDEMTVLRSVATAWTSEHIIEHDAYHRVFINKLRKGPKYKFSNAVAWFLTDDSKLPVYDQVARRGKTYLPFCITSNHWTQINRPLLVRTANQEEFEKSFHVLVTEPFLRSMMAPLKLERAYGDVLSRLSRYKNMSPDFARNIVADRHFMLAVAQEEGDEKIDELVENQFVDLANVLQEKNEELTHALEEVNISKDTAVDELSARITSLENKVTEESDKSSAVETQLQAEEKRRVEAEQATQQIENAFQNFKIALRDWTLFFVLFFVSGTLLWLTPFPSTWSWLANHSNKFLLKLTTHLSIAFLLFTIPIKKHRKWLIGIAIAFIMVLIPLAGS